ncbi:TcpE family conjugal transfer membrane protein [Lactococcus protaetiae]|uniref:Uncharacterized protein n=1 Tax=Lactococcus protaetiae TaxID=2592653 RepID=A0A514Z848_9LACT|nr:TcpE family conjugal transfer membrane protein [Lactococcus protaetiae]QDK70762.1 hypothetical protein FLP15_05820 [Lactococcus protaetiae]
MAENQRKELNLSYTRLYQQPHLVQHLFGNRYLERALRISVIFYGGGVGIVTFLFLWKIFQASLGFALASGVFSAYYGGIFLSELKPDGKHLPIFLKDWFVYRFEHWKKGYFYKGEFFEENLAELTVVDFEKKVREWNEEQERKVA